jgi:hypothetical protein
MEAVQTLSILLPLSFQSGWRLWATVFFIGLFIHLGWADAAPPSLTVLGWWPVWGVAAVMGIAELTADLFAGVRHAWHSINGLFAIIMVPAAVATLAIHADLPGGVVVIGVLLSGSLTAFSRLSKLGSRHLASAAPGANLGLAVAETSLAAPAALLSLNHPYIAMVIMALIAVLLLLVGPKLVRWGWFAVTCICMWTVSLFKVRRHPFLIRGHHMAKLGHFQPDMTVKCRAQKLRWSGGRKGYLCLTREVLAFVYCRWFVSYRCWKVPLKSIRGVYFHRALLRDSIAVYYMDESGNERLVRFAFTRYVSPLAEELGDRLNAYDLPKSAATPALVHLPAGTP